MTKWIGLECLDEGYSEESDSPLDTQPQMPCKDFMRDLRMLEAFVDEAIESETPGFVIGEDCSVFSADLADRYFDRACRTKDYWRENLAYSPRLELLFKVCRSEGLFGLGNAKPRTYPIDGYRQFNDLIERIRDKGRGTSFRRQLRLDQERSTAQFASVRAYVEGLFARKSRLVVLRLDLHYGDELNVPFDRAKRDLKRFLGNMRNKPSLFRDMEGYVWKLECGQRGGYHFHLFLIFDARHLKNDTYRAQCIGEYWRDVVTKGAGTYYNCNDMRYKAGFERQGTLGIGRIEHSDEAMRKNLLKVLFYLCKSDQCVPVKQSRSERTMGHGEPAKQPRIRLGRPRSARITAALSDFSAAKSQSI